MRLQRKRSEPGWVYFTLTNNSSRTAAQVDEPDPRGPNPFGRIIRLKDDADLLGMTWGLFLLSGAETNSLDPDGAGLTADSVHASSDDLWFDDGGLL